MYAVISEGALVALCDKPRYVKINENTGLYVRAEKEDAIGISVNGKLYNLPGSSVIAGAPEAIVRDGDVSEYVFSNRARIEVNAESTETAFVSVENAVCELDSSIQDRLAVVETALCELDTLITGGEEDE
ncbi:MAG: hypothetical protein LUH56_03010 [Oscillospiraceae bacterium]|nr:hypothetical protein [Oscillospiraceae bacterium]